MTTPPPGAEQIALGIVLAFLAICVIVAVARLSGIAAALIGIWLVYLVMWTYYTAVIWRERRAERRKAALMEPRP